MIENIANTRLQGHEPYVVDPDKLRLMPKKGSKNGKVGFGYGAPDELPYVTGQYVVGSGEVHVVPWAPRARVCAPLTIEQAPGGRSYRARIMGALADYLSRHSVEDFDRAVEEEIQKYADSPNR